MWKRQEIDQDRHIATLRHIYELRRLIEMRCVTWVTDSEYKYVVILRLRSIDANFGRAMVLKLLDVL